MYTGTLPPTTNRSTWAATVPVTNAVDDTGYDISGSTIVLEMTDKCGSVLLSATTDNGKIVIDDAGTSFTWEFSVSDVADIVPGTYPVGCTLETDDFTVSLIVATVEFMDGVVS